MRQPLTLMLALFCLGILMTPCSSFAKPVEAEKLDDNEDDVVCQESVEEGVAGHTEIDIVSLVTDGVGDNVEATLTVKGKITKQEEISYHMTIGSLFISYHYDDTSVWSMEDSGDEDYDDVEVTASGSTITATIPTEHLSKTDFECSAYSSEYDSEDIDEFISYSDSVPDDTEDDIFPEGGGRGPILNPFDTSYEDPEGDVVKQYTKKTVVSDHENIDIISLEVIESGSDELDVVLTMAGMITPSRDASYMILVGDAMISYSAGEGTIYYNDESEDDDVNVKDDTITAVLDNDKIKDTPYGGLFAMANEYPMTEDKSYSDMVPDDLWEDMDEYGIFELLSMITEFEITMKDPETTEIMLSYKDIDSDTASEMRADIDDYGDGDGEVTREEIDEFFGDTGMEEDAFYFSEMFAIDGKKGEAANEIVTEGLIGDVDSEMDAMFAWRSIIEFEIEESTSHTITIGEEYDEWEDEEDREGDEDWVEIEEGFDDDESRSDDEGEDADVGDEDTEDDGDVEDEDDDDVDFGQSDEDREDEDLEEVEFFDFSFTAAPGWIIDIENFPEDLEEFLSEDSSSFTISSEDMEEMEEEEEGLEILEFDIIEAMDDEDDDGEDDDEEPAEETETLSEGDEKTIEVGEKEFDVIVDEVDEEEDTVSLGIGDEEVTLGVGETKEIDTDGDGKDDTKVTLESIKNGKAELKFTEITNVKESDGDTPGFEIFLLLVGVVVVLCVMRRRQDQR